MLHISLFSGIGGFDLAAEWMGWQNIVSCELNPFGQKILKHYWPDAYHHDNVKTLTYQKINEELTKKTRKNWRSNDIILSGGFPCQPYSSAGKRKGTEDERHLWPEMLRVIREVSPRYVVGENVRGLTNWNGGVVFDEVQADLEAIGYQVLPFLLPACAVNAPHRRDRIWFVAYAESKQSQRLQFKQQEFSEQKQGEFRGNGGEMGNWNVANSNSSRIHKQYNPSESNESEKSCRISFKRGDFSSFPTKSPICGGNDGLPDRLDGITFSKWRNESIKAYGNAIVPQVVYQIFKVIEKMK